MIWVMTWSCDSVELVALELGHIPILLPRSNAIYLHVLVNLCKFDG